MLDRPAHLNATIIDKAFNEGDSETVIAAYIDVLDYTREVTSETTLTQVLDSMSYSKHIDHVLFGHLKDQMEKRGFDCRLYSAVYYFNANGPLTAADLLTALAVDSSVAKVPNSALFKRELLDRVIKDDWAGDADVKDELVKAIKAVAPKLDSDYYELPADFLSQETVEAPVEGRAQMEQ